MNQLATQQERIPMDSVGVSNTGTGTKIAPQNLGEVVKFAEVMCRADIALPKHLRGNAGACMAVAMQALEWQMSPFAVASKSYAVNGAIAYEAQLIAAVVNTRSGIKGRLRYRFDGDAGAMTCTVTGVLDGEECVYTSPPIGSIKTKNSPLWTSDPQQQLGYFAARSWARRHCPEVILGVYDRDEAEDFRGPDRAKDITDRVVVDPFSDDPITPTQAAKEERQAADATDIDNETFDPSTGEIIDNESPETGSAPSEPGADAPPQASAREPEGESPPSSGSTPIDDAQLTRALKDFARKAFRTASDPTLSPEQRDSFLDDMREKAREEFPRSVWGKFNTIRISAGSVIKQPKELEARRKSIAVDILYCPVSEIGGA